MSQQVTRILSIFLLVLGAVTTGFAQGSMTAKTSGYQPGSGPASGNESDRSRDGLLGPVRRVRTEVVKLSNSGGKTLEDSKRVLLETAEYDLKGSKTQNQYFPIAGATLTGREVYKYDEKGNISEMTLVNADGSLVSKEVYNYDYDSVGNWVKMTTAVAVVGNGKIEFEPTEATYRTIFYYLDAAMAAMMQPSGNPPPATTSPVARNDRPAPPVESPSNNGSAAKQQQPARNTPARVENETKTAAGLPPTTSFLEKSRGATVKPVVAETSPGSPDLNKTVVVKEDNAPPPPRPLLKPVSGGVLNGVAVSLPAPSYPDIARRMRVSGLVEIEVVVDEDGKVVSAKALAGPAALREAAVQAAYRARFTPTKLSGQPVKISGRINYNFTLP